MTKRTRWTAPELVHVICAAQDMSRGEFESQYAAVKYLKDHALRRRSWEAIRWKLRETLGLVRPFQRRTYR